MKKISKSLIIINIISLILVHVFQLSKYSILYLYYNLAYLDFITIIIGVTSIISAIIELKNKNILIGILNILVSIQTLPISFTRNTGYAMLFIPLIISIVNLVLLTRKPNNDNINLISIVSIIICTLIELFFISLPIVYGHSSINNFENALPQIEQLNSYKGKKTTDLEGFNLIINDKKIRLEHQKNDNLIIFTDIYGNKLFEINTLFGYLNSIDFINYIITIGEYEIILV